MSRNSYRDLIHAPDARTGFTHPELVRYLLASNLAAITGSPSWHAKATERFALMQAARTCRTQLRDTTAEFRAFTYGREQ